MPEDTEGLRRLGPQDYREWAGQDDTAGSQSAGRGQATARRDAGLRQNRRLTTWTAAGLIAGVAATVGYFAHHPAVTAGSGSAVTTSGATAVNGHKPVAGHTVVTSGGSGVTAGVSGGGAGGTTTGGGTATWHDN